MQNFYQQWLMDDIFIVLICLSVDHFDMNQTNIHIWPASPTLSPSFAS